MYLIYLVTGEGKSIPTLSLIMIAAIKGVQALVFIMRQKWNMIGWTLSYIIAIPAFSFFLPLYLLVLEDGRFLLGSNLGESGKKIIVHVSTHLFLRVHDANSLIRRDEGKFDPRSIPLKSWNDYVSFSCTLLYPFVNTLHQENELWRRNRITVSGPGSLKPKQKKSTQILALIYTAEKLTTSLKDTVSPQPHLSSACTHLQDTNQVAIPHNPSSDQ
jgi:hypothetical protein